MYEKFWNARTIFAYWSERAMTVGEYVKEVRAYLLELQSKYAFLENIFVVIRQKAEPIDVRNADAFADMIIRALRRDIRYLNEDVKDMKPHLSSKCEMSYSILFSNSLEEDGVTIRVTTGGIGSGVNLASITCHDASVSDSDLIGMFKISVAHWGARDGRLGVSKALQEGDFSEVYIGWATFVRSTAVLNCVSPMFEVEPFDGGALIRLHGDNPVEANEESLAGTAAVRECLERSGVLHRDRLIDVWGDRASAIN